MAVEAKARWRGHEPSALTDEELAHAIEFCADSYNELSTWSPILIWSYFSALLAELTIEQTRRLRFMKAK